MAIAPKVLCSDFIKYFLDESGLADLYEKSVAANYTFEWQIDEKEYDAALAQERQDSESRVKIPFSFDLSLIGILTLSRMATYPSLHRFDSP